MTATIQLHHLEGHIPAATRSSAWPPAREMEAALRAEMLADARSMTDGIAGVLSRLRYLHSLLPQETDTTRLDEIAALFSDIADFAAYGARAARRAADAVRPGPETRGTVSLRGR